MSNGILIVDDASFMRMMIKDILTKMVLLLLEKQKMALKQLKSTKSLILI